MFSGVKIDILLTIKDNTLKTIKNFVNNSSDTQHFDWLAPTFKFSFISTEKKKLNQILSFSPIRYISRTSLKN